jgi:hypothetical protein
MDFFWAGTGVAAGIVASGAAASFGGCNFKTLK